jgi:DNA-binding transcriptional ArsR family regulator
MVKYKEHQTDDLDRLFSALADPTRRAILARLCEGEATVGEIAEPLPMSWPAVTKHLGILETAGLINRTAEGRVRRCTASPRALKPVADWVEDYRRFWESSLDALGDYLEQTKPEKESKDDCD